MTRPRRSSEETRVRRDRTRVEALRPAEEKQFSFPEDDPNPVILISNRGAILYHNKDALPLLEGLGWKEGKGMPQALYDYLEQAIETKTARNAELRCGKRVYAVTFVPDKKGEYVTAYGFDATDWRAAEEKFKNLVETINDWVWEIDTNGVYTYASPKVRDLLGYEPQEVIGKTCFDLMSPEDAHRVSDIFEGVIEAEEPFAGLRNKCVRKDGTEIIVETAGTPIFDSEGNLTGYRGADRDITDRVLVEDELRESRDFIENLIQSSADGILAYDHEFRYTVWNPGMEKISGMSKEQVVGKCAFEVFPFLTETGENKLMLCALEGDTTTATDRHYVIPETGREGFFAARYGPLRSESGEIIGGLGVIRDTTEQKRTERTIRESEERFRQLAENIRQVFWVIAADFSEVFYVSPAYEEVWGRTCESLYENPASWFDSVVEEDRAWLVEAVQKKLRGAKTESKLSPYRITWPDGSIHWIQARSVPIKDETGKITRIAGVAEDITEGKLAEQERERLLGMLEAKNKELQSVVYIASHDLRSPLVNIYGFTRQLSESCAELQNVLKETAFSEEARTKILPLLNEDIPQALNFIHSGADKMQMVIDGLLKISRVGTAHLTIAELDISRIVGDIIEAMGYEISQRQAEVVVEELPGCMGDRDQIDQAFSNLLHNAVKYLHPERKGRVKVWGRQEGRMSVYCVEDNGIGIPPEHQRKVFEIFHRVDPTGPVAGEGLGLSIVSRILDRHNGRVWLESQPGQGSKFFVAIPAS